MSDVTYIVGTPSHGSLQYERMVSSFPCVVFAKAPSGGKMGGSRNEALQMQVYITHTEGIIKTATHITIQLTKSRISAPALLHLTGLSHLKTKPDSKDPSIQCLHRVLMAINIITYTGLFGSLVLS